MVNNMEIDIERLRSDLIDYFGTGMMSGIGAFIVNISIIEKASPDKLIEIAINNNFNLENYKNENIKIIKW